METGTFTIDRIQLASVVLGTIFLFFGLVSCVIAAIRRQVEARALVWLGLWSGMFGASLLLRTAPVFDALPRATQLCVPFTINAIRFLLVVAAMLVWSELTLGKMRLLAQTIARLGGILAFAGIARFILVGWDEKLIPLNNLLAVCALIFLALAVVVPRLSTKYLVFPNRILAVSTLVFTADALFRNVSGWLRLPRIELPLLDETAFAFFLFSFAYVAGQKVFANERRLLAIESELEVARQIQASILPSRVPTLDSLQIAACYLPMTAVGGDFYEFIQLDTHHLGILIADVSGHGVPAALISAMLKVAIQPMVPCAHKPAEVLRGLNRILSGQLRGQLISAAYLWLDTETNTALYSSAGHPPLLRWREGRLGRIESNGLLFGVLPDVEYPVCKIPIQSGDRFLLHTDGMIEPENRAGEPFGDHRLEEVIRDNPLSSPGKICDRLVAEIQRWQPANETQQDDITVLVVDVA